MWTYKKSRERELSRDFYILCLNRLSLTEIAFHLVELIFGDLAFGIAVL